MAVQLVGSRVRKKLPGHERFRSSAMAGQMLRTFLSQVDCEIKVVQDAVVEDDITIDSFADHQVLATNVPVKDSCRVIQPMVTWMTKANN